MVWWQHVKNIMANKGGPFAPRKTFYILHVLLSSPTLLPMSLLIPTPTTNMDGQSGAKTSRKLESSKVSGKAWTPPKLEKKLELEQSVRKSVRATLPAADTELCHWRNSRTHTLERWWGRCWRWCDDSDLGKKQRIPYYIYFIKLGQSRPTAGKA